MCSLRVAQHGFMPRRGVAAVIVPLSLALIVSGCSTSHTAHAQAPSQPVPVSATPPKPAVEADKATPPIEQTNYDRSKDPFANPPETPGAVSVIRARVNNVPILDIDVRAGSFHELHRRELAEMPENERMQVIQEILSRSLQDIIDRELVLTDLQSSFGKKRPQYLTHIQDAAKKECDKQLKSIKKSMEKNGLPVNKDDDVKRFFTMQGTTLESYRRHFERNFMMMEYLRALIYPGIKTAIGHPEIMEYYEHHAAEFETTDNVVWQDVFIDASRFRSAEEARRVAEQVRDRAAKGEDFVALVKQFDQGDSSWRQGEGTGHRPGEVQPAVLEPILFKMKAKEVGPVVEMPNGFHVVRVDKREYTGRKPLNEELQTEIRRKLMNEMAGREQRRILVELRRKATIEVISTGN